MKRVGGNRALSRRRGSLPSPSYGGSEKPSISVAQLSVALGLSIHTIYKMIKTGRVLHLQPGSILSFDRAAIADWIDGCTFA